MAIIFNKTVDFNKWVLSENNIVLDFYDDTTRIPIKCDVVYGSTTIQTLYPHPDGSFYTNLTNLLSTYVNDYDDDLDITGLDITNIDGFLFDWSKVSDINILELTITFDNSEQETEILNLSLLLGGEQPYDFKRGYTISQNDNFILSPLKKETTNRVHLNYWNGYPFDFGFTLKDVASGDIIIKNITNGINSTNANTTTNVTRLFISNGDTTQTLENFLPLANGYNDLEVYEQNTEDKLISFIDLWKKESDCGIYVKWLNQYGGYNYWLFNSNHEEDLNTRGLGEINNDFNNLADTISQSKSLGKTSDSSLNVLADNLTKEDINVLKGVLESSKVYLFTGQRFTKNTFNDWLEVFVGDKSQDLRDFKGNTPELRLKLELPKHYNISL